MVPPPLFTVLELKERDPSLSGRITGMKRQENLAKAGWLHHLQRRAGSGVRPEVVGWLRSRGNSSKEVVG